MRITVAVCTWNRCHLLKQTLEQMTKLSIPAGVEWELLVVNNNSTDETDEVIESFAGRLPVRRLFEPKPGKSNALNLAVREAGGDYIIWTDNDVLVDTEWVAEYCRAFEQRPEAAVFGGTIEPWFEGTPPAWLRQILPRVINVYGTPDYGDEPVPFTKDIYPWGANMAVRAKEQAQFLYDTNLGPRPNSGLRGEEASMVQTMLAAGVVGWWIPQARVRHYVPKDIQTLEHLRGYYGGYGEYSAQQLPERAGQELFGKPRWLWRQAVEAELKYRLRRLLGRSPEVWIEDLITSSHGWGYLRAYKPLPVKDEGELLRPS
jgi:glycosyltransferase involved in cell wall biosynthesis